jgi:SAM-dependent methyltransferase
MPTTSPAAAALAAAVIDAEDARKGELAILLGLAVEAEEGQAAGPVTAAVRARLDDYLSIWQETTDEALSLALLYLLAHFPQDRSRVLDTATTLPLDPEDLSRLRRALSELDPENPDIGRVFPHPAAWAQDDAARQFDQARIRALGAEKIARLWQEDTETVLGHLGVKARWAERNGPVVPASSDSVPDRDVEPAAAGAELLAQHAAAFRCPGCGGDSLRLEGNLATCPACSNAYPIEKGILDLTARVGESGDDFLLKLAQVPGMGHYYEAHARPNFVRLCGSNWAGQVLPSDEDDYIASHVRPVDGPVLDLAAGAGRWTEVLAKTVGADRVIALDLLLPMLVTLRGRLPEVPAVLASADTLPFGDATLGAVLCWNALQAFPAVAPAAIAEVARCLKPGGTFTLLTFRDSDDPVYRYFARRHRFPAHNDGLTLFDRDELVGWLTEAGLEVHDETAPGTFVIINAVRRTS